MSRLARNVLAVEQDTAACECSQTDKRIEEGGLASAVRADDTMDHPGGDREVDRIHGNESAELYGDASGLQERCQLESTLAAASAVAASAALRRSRNARQFLDRISCGSQPLRF